MSPKEATMSKYKLTEKGFISNNWLIKKSHKFCLPQILILLLSDNIIFYVHSMDCEYFYVLGESPDNWL